MKSSYRIQTLLSIPVLRVSRGQNSAGVSARKKGIHLVQRVIWLVEGWNPHCRLQRQHGTFPEASLMSKLNGTLL